VALKKSVEFKGQTAEYWMIGAKGWDKISESCSCRLGLYFNRQSRTQSLKNIIDAKDFRFEGDLTVAQMYEAIKAQATVDEDGNEVPGFFSDAEDV
jgi:hypothetical protein